VLACPRLGEGARGAKAAVRANPVRLAGAGRAAPSGAGRGAREPMSGGGR
jgi:hypothetical protein